MKRISCITIVVCLLLFVSLFAFAETGDLDSLSYEQLLELRDEVYEQIKSRPEYTNGDYPVWDGIKRMGIYEDDTVYLEFNGFYKWTSKWYIPNIVITNKTDETVYFAWDEVKLNRCVVGAANGGKIELSGKARGSLATLSMCSITLKDNFMDIYGDEAINLFELNFPVYDSDKNLAYRAKCAVECNIDIAELMAK